MSGSTHLLMKRHRFQCPPPPSVRDDYGNCLNFQTQKWDLQGPKDLLLTNFIISIAAGLLTIVFAGSEGRAMRKNKSDTKVKWVQNHSMTLAMVLALCYFIVNDYLVFVQYQQRSLDILCLLIDLARTKPQGSSDYLVTTLLLFNKSIYANLSHQDKLSYKFPRVIFLIAFTISNFVSAILDIYTDTDLAIQIGNKGDDTSFSEIIPKWVNTLFHSFNTVAYALTTLAGVYFIFLALKLNNSQTTPAQKRQSALSRHTTYRIYYAITAVAFLIRSIPGLVLSILSDWFGWTWTYSMNFLISTVYAVCTIIIFWAWSRATKAPVDGDTEQPVYGSVQQWEGQHVSQDQQTGGTGMGWGGTKGPEYTYRPVNTQYGN